MKYETLLLQIHSFSLESTALYTQFRLVCLFSHAFLCARTHVLSLYNTQVVWVCVFETEGLVLSARFGLLSTSPGDTCLTVVAPQSSMMRMDPPLYTVPTEDRQPVSSLSNHSFAQKVHAYSLCVHV